MTEPETIRPRIGHLRYLIVLMLFIASSVNYADRSALSAAKRGLTTHFYIDAQALGMITAAWGWSYVLAQIPSGRLLDRFGARRIYGLSIFVWSVLILLHGFVQYIPDAGLAFLALLVLNYLVGLSEAPAFPGNGRLVATWFPTRERGTASAIFNSSQYFATVLFLPIMGWSAASLGWPSVFWLMGTVGVLLTVVWFRAVHGPRQHPWLGAAELEYISQNGALVDMGKAKGAAKKTGWFYVRQILTSRMLVGVYIGQYCITTLTYFFVQWIIPYLVDQRHMSLRIAALAAALPAIFGFVGGVCGGVLSDLLLRKGCSLSVARKTPIILGMLAASTVIACNYVNSDWLILSILCFAFLGKGIGALGWTVVSDTSPKEIIGLCGGIFNMIGNSAQITLAYAVGALVKATGNFNVVLLFVAANAIGAILCYTLVVGPIRRLELKEPAGEPAGGPG
ncbi:MAG: MFS transporter [Phycisphaerae bacterium]